VQKLIGRTENPRFPPAWQTTGYSPVEELIDRDAKSLVTQPEVQFDSGPGRVGERHVMTYCYGFGDWEALLVARACESVAGGSEIPLGYGQIQIHGRLPEERGFVVTLGEQRALQCDRRNSLIGKEA
jgi:hypothetical protein